MKVTVNLPSRRERAATSADPIRSERKIISKPRKLTGGNYVKPQVKPLVAIPVAPVVSSPDSEKSVIDITITDGRFAILRPKRSIPEDCEITLTKDKEVLLDFLKEVKLVDSDDAVSFDTETTGTWIFGNKDFRMTTLGLGHGMKAVSLDVRNWPKKEIKELLLDVKYMCVAYGIKLIAHNLFYDASVVSFYTGCVQGFDAPGWMPYLLDTYSLFRYLSSEGFMGQMHSLKFAMKELLLWKDTNEAEQHDWLINNGYIKGNKGIHSPNNKLSTPEERLAAVRSGVAEGKQYKPDKGMMCQVPHEILGKYNALDCFATYRLYRDVLLPAKRKYTPKFFHFWQTEVMVMTIRNAVDNYRQGINIDMNILGAYKKYMRKRMLAVYKLFSKGKRREIFYKMADEKIKLYTETKKPKVMYKAVKPLKAEPAKKYDKSGYLTKAWMNWEVARRRYNPEPKLSPAGMKYVGRLRLLKKMWQDRQISLNVDKKHWAYKFLFNPGSVDDKTTYLFHKVTYEIIPSKFEGRAGRLRLKNGVEVDLSDTGNLPTGKSAITAIGGMKHELNIFNKEIKKLQFVTTTYDKVSQSTDGLLHIGYKVPGTNTQRLSGDGGLNLQNIVKDPEFLKAWQCKKPEDEVITQVDLCYHKDTEVLTQEGWKTFPQLSKQDLVWEVDPTTLKGAWMHPINIIRHEYSGPLYVIGNNRGRLRVTQNHKMLYVGQHHSTRKDKPNRRWIQKAHEGIPSEAACLPVNAAPAEELHTNWSEHDIWMAAMLQADGSVNKSATLNRTYSIEVARPYKRAKVQELLGRAGASRPGRDENRLETETWSGVSFTSPLLESSLTGEKLFRVDLIGDNQMDLLLEALAFWDGSYAKADSIVFTTVNKVQADLIQLRLARTGFECKIAQKFTNKDKPYYHLYIHKNDRIRLRKSDIQIIEDFNDTTYCLTVPKGFFLVRSEGQTFVGGNCAVEPHIFAELSRDPSMLKLYGPDAKPNDVYLFTGAMMGGAIGQPFLNMGYDPLNPTKEAMKACKEKYKALRNVAKSLCLSDDYGSGAYKKWQTLKIQGFDYTMKEVEVMHNQLAEVYKGKKLFSERLKREWERNKGRVLDAFGFPVCVDRNKIKDLANRVIQKSGHMILQLWQYFVTKELWKRRIPYYWLIMDFHDEFMPIVKLEYAKSVKEIYSETLAMVNKDYLSGMIKIKAEPQLATCLAEIKVENYSYEPLKHVLDKVSEL